MTFDNFIGFFSVTLYTLIRFKQDTQESNTDINILVYKTLQINELQFLIK